MKKFDIFSSTGRYLGSIFASTGCAWGPIIGLVIALLFLWLIILTIPIWLGVIIFSKGWNLISPATKAVWLLSIVAWGGFLMLNSHAQSACETFEIVAVGNELRLKNNQIFQTELFYQPNLETGSGWNFQKEKFSAGEEKLHSYDAPILSTNVRMITTLFIPASCDMTILP